MLVSQGFNYCSFQKTTILIEKEKFELEELMVKKKLFAVTPVGH